MLSCAGCRRQHAEQGEPVPCAGGECYLDWGPADLPNGWQEAWQTAMDTEAGLDMMAGLRDYGEMSDNAADELYHRSRLILVTFRNLKNEYEERRWQSNSK